VLCSSAPAVLALDSPCTRIPPSCNLQSIVLCKKSMPKQKWYVVIVGIEPGVYSRWYVREDGTGFHIDGRSLFRAHLACFHHRSPDTSSKVIGVPGAQYEAFTTERGAHQAFWDAEREGQVRRVRMGLDSDRGTESDDNDSRRTGSSSRRSGSPPEQIRSNEGGSTHRHAPSSSGRTGTRSSPVAQHDNSSRMSSLRGSSAPQTVHTHNTGASVALSSPRTGVTFNITERPSQATAQSTSGPSVVATAPSVSSPSTGETHVITASLRAVRISDLMASSGQRNSTTMAAPAAIVRAHSAPESHYPTDIQGPVDVTRPRHLRGPFSTTRLTQAARDIWAYDESRTQSPFSREVEGLPRGNSASSSPPTAVTQYAPGSCDSPCNLAHDSPHGTLSSLREPAPLSAPHPSPEVSYYSQDMDDDDKQGSERAHSPSMMRSSFRDSGAPRDPALAHSINIQTHNNATLRPPDTNRRAAFRSGNLRAQVPSPPRASSESAEAEPNSPVVARQAHAFCCPSASPLDVIRRRPEDTTIEVPLSMYCNCEDRPAFAVNDEPTVKIKVAFFCKCPCPHCGWYMPPWKKHECREISQASRVLGNSQGLDISRSHQTPGSISSGLDLHDLQFPLYSSTPVYPEQADPRSPVSRDQTIPISLEEAAFNRPSPLPPVRSLAYFSTRENPGSSLIIR
jgi:hypothetical protein